MKYFKVDVLIPAKIDSFYSYNYKSEEDFSLVGRRITVPLNNSIRVAIVFTQNKIDNEQSDLKFIDKILDESPFLPVELLNLAEFISVYYAATLGETVKLLLPNGTLPFITKMIHLNNNNFDLAKVAGKSKIKSDILNILQKKESISINNLEELLNKKINSQINDLKKLEIISIEFKINEASVREKYNTYLFPIDPKLDFSKNIRSNAIAQKKIIKLLQDLTKPISKSDLLTNGRFSSTAINKLIEKNIIYAEEFQVKRISEFNFNSEKKNITLTDKQKAIISKIKKDINQFSVHLLHGITGSGKTIIYIELIKEVIKQNKSAIVLIPEIALTPQTVARFKGYFGEIVCFIHSKLSQAERFDIWQGVKENEYKIIIGPRSVSLTPAHNIGIIIVDEEHEWTYKQSDQIPRYNARDLSIYRARMNNCPIILGSATPSLESYYNAKKENYKLHQLLERPNNFKLPDIEVINLNDVIKSFQSSDNLYLTEKMEIEIEKTLLRKEQIIIFQNKRGYSTFLLCNSCTHVHECPNCSISLVFHKQTNNFICHYCHFEEKQVTHCQKCKSEDISLKGFGTQKIEELIKNKFPSSRVLRMDQDSTRKKNSHFDILRNFEEHKADILIGTQMITKGLDFENVTLVCVLNADQSLNIPDFRSSERTFQLISQVSGRSGRGEKHGKVLIQTYQPEHYALLNSLKNDYESFYTKELGFRQDLNYPPVKKMIAINIKSINLSLCEKYSSILFDELYKNLKDYSEILGPAPNVIQKVNKYYRWQILIKISSESSKIKNIVKYYAEYFNRREKDIRINIDVDPYDLI